METNLYEKLKAYFCILSHTGYIKNDVVEGLIVLDYIKDLTRNYDLELLGSCEDMLIINELLNRVNFKMCL